MVGRGASGCGHDSLDLAANFWLRGESAGAAVACRAVGQKLTSFPLLLSSGVI